MSDLISRQALCEYALNQKDKCVTPNDIMRFPSAEPDVPDTNVGDTISRRAAIDALWKALYDYEDKTEKQFIESDELDVGEWIGHRIFAQNMNDIDRQTILNLPSAQPEIIRCGECKHCYIDGENVRFNVCELNHNKVQSDDWFCADAERRTDG